MTKEKIINIKKHTYKLGEDVSSGFNGNWRHIGKVAHLTNWYLTTDTGLKFRKHIVDLWTPSVQADVPTEVFRQVNSPSWVLAHGIIHECNPHI